MHTFSELMRDGWKCIAVHRKHVVIHTVLDAVLLLMQGFLWKHLYAAGIVHTASFEQALTYIVLGSTLLHALHLKVGSSIVRTVRAGTFYRSQLCLMPLFVQHIARETGAALFHLVMHALPLMGMMHLVFGLLPPSCPAALSAFLLTVVLGRVIASLLNCVLGYISLWFSSEKQLIWMEEILMMIFGGAVLPMWFYPDWLSALCAELPFKYVKSYAVNLYLGRVPADHVWEIVLVQLFWITGLLVLERVLWSSVQRRIVGYKVVHGVKS